MSTLIVSLESIKNNSLIEGNAEPAKLRAAVVDAQRAELKSLLGTSLFNLFYNAVSADGTLTGLTSIQEEFYDDHIVPLMAKYSEARFIYSTSYQISNVGLAQTANGNVKNASDEAIDKAYKRARNDGDLYAIRAKDFILRPENNADLGVYYFESNQPVVPLAKTSQGFIYTPNRRSGDDCCPPPGR